MAKAAYKQLKVLLTVAGACLAIVALGFWLNLIAKHWDAIQAIEWDTAAWVSALAALLLYGLHLALSVQLWRWLLVMLGTVHAYLPLQAVYLISLLCRYVPGNILQYLGRVYLGTRIGIPLATVSMSVVLELLLFLMVAAVIVVTGLAFGDAVATGNEAMRGAGAQVGMLLAGCMFIVLLVKPTLRLLHHMAPQRWQLPAMSNWSLARLLGQLLGILVIFVILGLVMELMASGILKVKEPRFLFLTWAFALSWTLGSITPGAPAGIGVRDAVLLALLSMHYTEEQALALSLYSRVVSLLGDALYTLFAMVYTRRQFTGLLRKPAHPS